MDKKEAVIKEIIVVTDGQSNVGGNPVTAARAAYRKGITVNTIGIIDKREGRGKPLEEIADIAEAGGGIYEYTYVEDLFQTIQSITYRTVNRTIQEVVNKQLKEIIGQNLEEMSPDCRSKILNYIDSYSDDVALQCCILIDTSGSMRNKIVSARNSLLDLVDSFKNRKGKVSTAIIAYPDFKGDYKLIFDFDEDLKELQERLYDIKPQGSTPTALAIYAAIEAIENYNKKSIDKEMFGLKEAML